MCNGWRPKDDHFETPPYLVMKACVGLGFQAPLEVRWSRMSRFLCRPGLGQKRPRTRLWEQVFGLGSPREITCPCGQPLPGLEKYTLKVFFEPETQYLLGQCCQCLTIYWEVAESPRLDPPAGIWWD